MRALPFLALFLLLVVAGCSKTGNVVGKWKVDPTLSDASAPPEQRAQMIGFGSTFHFEFKPDKTFVGAITEGTYTLDGNKLTMKTTKVLGQDVSKAPAAAGATEINGELSDDGQTLILHPTFVGLSDALKDGVRMVRDGP